MVAATEYGGGGGKLVSGEGEPEYPESLSAERRQKVEVESNSIVESHRITRATSVNCYRGKLVLQFNDYNNKR